FGKPAVKHFDEAVAEHARFHHAAVKKNMRGAGQSCRAAPYSLSLGAGLRLLREEPRQVFSDGRVSGVWKAKLLKTYAALSGRHVIARGSGKESINQGLRNVVASNLCLDSAA